MPGNSVHEFQARAQPTARERLIVHIHYAIQALGDAQRADDFFCRAQAAPSDNAVIQIAREYLALVPHDEGETA